MVGTVGTVISLTVLIASVVNSRKRRVRKAEELGLSASLDEAEAATSRLTALYRSLPNGLRQLMVQIGQELTALRVAEIEFHGSAFSPFWDQVEAVARGLSRIEGVLRCLADGADNYYKELQEWDHSFPPLPVGEQDVPDIEILIATFQRIVRLGQTNVHFAVVRENRRKREPLVEDFMGLKASSLSFAANALRRSLEQGLAQHTKNAS